MLGGNRDLVCANDTWAVAEDRRGWSRLKSASASAGDTTRNMIHNDLKPRSFLLDSNLELKLPTSVALRKMALGLPRQRAHVSFLTRD